MDEGTPQGGPLSPLLSNLVLDELDRELERRGHRFVRYADDCNIYVRSERAGQRVMESMTSFITQRSSSRSTLRRVRWRDRRSGSFWASASRAEWSRSGGLRRRRSARFKQKVRELTRRTRGVSIEQMVEELVPLSAGLAGLLRLLPNPIGVA